MIVSKHTQNGDIIKELHQKPLYIGNENLKEFNERMETITVLQYDHTNKSFKIHFTKQNLRMKYLSDQFLIELNRFLTLDRNADFDEEFIKTEYVKRVKESFYELQQEIRGGHKLKKEGLTTREKEDYLYTIDELIKLRKDSFPKGVLTNNEIIQNCKDEINALCEDLSKEIVRKKQQ